ncbi:MAG: hypothetical protein ACWA41_12880 [Putridiphycobacter sp.]
MKDKDNKENGNQKKIWAGYLALIFVIFHFSAIFISTLPENYSPKPVYAFSHQYVSPLFNQQWSMFAPCPLTEHTLRFKLYFDKDSSGMQQPSTDYLKYHAWFRFSHHGDLAVGEYNLMYWIMEDIKKLGWEPNQIVNEKEQQAFEKTMGYFLLKNYLTGYALNTFNQKPKKADVYLDYYNVKTKEMRTYTLYGLK